MKIRIDPLQQSRAILHTVPKERSRPVLFERSRYSRDAEQTIRSKSPKKPTDFRVKHELAKPFGGLIKSYVGFLRVLCEPQLDLCSGPV